MPQRTIDTAAIWSRLSDDLRRYLRRRVADDHTADDLLQDVFVRIHAGVEALDDIERLPAWVYQIARNVVTDHYRRKRPELLASMEAIDARADDERLTLIAAARKWLAEIVDTLPAQAREAVRLAELDGLTHREVAQRLGVSLTAAKSRVQRGREALKRALDACCQFEIDRRGNVINCVPRPERTVCMDCEEGAGELRIEE